MTNKFEDYQQMIFKLVNQRYHQMKRSRPEVELDELIAEGYYIYSWCVVNFDGSKGMKFSTYLYMQLRERLLDYYECTMKPQQRYEDLAPKDSRDTYESTLIKDYELESDVMDYAAETLSYEALNVLKFILSREWENKNNRLKPSEATISRKFGYPREVVNSIMGELKSFWNKEGWKVA